MQERISKKPLETEMALPVDRAALDEEISLVDVWLVVWRNRWWPVAGLLIGLAVAIAYATLSTPVYESHASIKIGNVPNSGLRTQVLIEDPNVLSVELIDEYGQKSVRKTSGVPYLEKKKVQVRSNILDLAAIGHRPEEPRDLLKQIVTKILQRHRQSYENAIAPLRQRFAAIDQQISILTTQMKELGDLVGRLKESNPVQASLVAIERGHLYSNLDQLERDRVSLQQQTATPYVSPTRIIARPELPDVPISPRKVVALVVGVVLGLVAGLIAIFLKEFLASVRRVTESSSAHST